MSYPRQDSVTKRLQGQILRHMDKAKAYHNSRLSQEWKRTRQSLMGDIASAYRAAQSGSERWSLPALVSGGTWRALQMRFAATMGQFHVRSSSIIKTAVSDMTRQSAVRHAWMLDQISPEGTKVRVPRKNMREADIPLNANWPDRWDEWVNAYTSALTNNVRLNALNEGSMEDAVAEVDATRANTPAYTLESALQRLFDYEADAALVGGMHQAVDENPDLEEVEVWRTRGDLRVCDDCDENEGLPSEDADGEIPLHPNCNCFYQIVPPSFAEMLRSGDEDMRNLADQMDAEGIAPNAMVIRDVDGNIAGKTVVDFGDWEAAQGMAVAGQI